MGFPVGYSELPKPLLHLLLLLYHLRRLISFLLGPLCPRSETLTLTLTLAHPVDRALPALRFDELGLPGPAAHGVGWCAVCLDEFEGAAEVRRPTGCGHVFHRACLDRWILAAHARRTCPLCRAPLVSGDGAGAGDDELAPLLIPLCFAPS